MTENANCTMLNVSGHTPIDLACQSGHAQVMNRGGTSMQVCTMCRCVCYCV